MFPSALFSLPNPLIFASLDIFLAVGEIVSKLPSTFCAIPQDCPNLILWVVEGFLGRTVVIESGLWLSSVEFIAIVISWVMLVASSLLLIMRLCFLAYYRRIIRNTHRLNYTGSFIKSAHNSRKVIVKRFQKITGYSLWNYRAER